MTYPVGTVVVSKISDKIPVWIKTEKGWFFVIPFDVDSGFLPVEDDDFETEDDQWLFIEPQGLTHG